MAVDRTAIFIDAAYLDSVLAREFQRVPIDFGRLATELAAGKELLRAYYYNCPPYQSNPATVDEAQRKASADRFYAALKKIPRFDVRLGRLEKRYCQSCNAANFRQKRVDILLAVDLVNLSAKQQISRAVLVAGDSDFLPAVFASKDAGVLVHLYHGGRGNPPHRDLYDACDERTQIDQALIDKVRRSTSVP